MHASKILYPKNQFPDDGSNVDENLSNASS